MALPLLCRKQQELASNLPTHTSMVVLALRASLFLASAQTASLIASQQDHAPPSLSVEI